MADAHAAPPQQGRRSSIAQLMGKISAGNLDPANQFHQRQEVTLTADQLAGAQREHHGSPPRSPTGGGFMRRGSNSGHDNTTTTTGGGGMGFGGMGRRLSATAQNMTHDLGRRVSGGSGGGGLGRRLSASMERQDEAARAKDAGRHRESGMEGAIV